MRVLKKEWLQPCAMRRIVLHWTAGAYKASNSDKSHYHFCVEDDGTIVRGYKTILDNVSTSDQVYAMHTRGLNTGSIGIAVCCMFQATETPFKPGPYPMTKKQAEVLCLVAADLCEFYNLSPSKDVVLGHGEVEDTLGVQQAGKWDPMVLPWDTKVDAGEWFRTRIKAALNDTSEVYQNIDVHIVSKLTGKLIDGTSYLPLRAIMDHLGWSIKFAAGTEAIVINDKNTEISIPLKIIEGVGYTPSRNMAELIKMPIAWDNTTQTVIIG